MGVLYYLIMILCVYVILGCIAYLRVAHINEREIGINEQILYYLCGIVFKPIIKPLLHMDNRKFKKQFIKEQIKSIEESSKQKLTKEEKKLIKDIINIFAECEKEDK